MTGPREIKLPENTELVFLAGDGVPVLACLACRSRLAPGDDPKLAEYAGHRPCPRCLARRLAAEESRATGGDAA